MEVFISHSHRDRHEAIVIRDIVERYGAQTFFDQEEIYPGDDLPDRIQEGIDACDLFLLVWSGNAASSEWVQNEWNLAYESRKRIIPYVLDGMPLPQGLRNLVYIDSTDQQHGNAKLLKTVFGEDFSPPPEEVFPGQWRATVDAFGMGQATYELELRENGQIEGEGGLNESGAIWQLADPDMHGLLKTRIPIHGNWYYDDRTQMLTLETVSSGFGQTQQDTVRIHATGREKGQISGKDLGGRIWVLQKASSTAVPQANDMQRQHLREQIQQTYDSLKNSPMMCALLSALCLGIQSKGTDLGISDQLLLRVGQGESGACERMLSQLKKEGWIN